MSKTYPPRLAISAIRGGSGKTVLTLGLARTWRNQGFRVAAFKKGPDYIDAGWLSLASGGRCHNLDPFLMPGDTIERSFLTRACGADVGLIEGNRGLFDGSGVQGRDSTADLARMLSAPVALVLDCTKMTRTAAAIVLGCRHFDPELDLVCVILNQVAQRRHESVLRRAIEEGTGVPVLGALPRMKKDPLPMRHLGVTPWEEFPGAQKALDELGRLIKDHVDTQALKETAKKAGALSTECENALKDPLFKKAASSGLRIGVFRDAAFQFYYPENLEAIECAGGRLVFLNALSDKVLPEIDALYIGGGFPETQALALSANTELISSLKRRVEQGLPVYAECGGLMYLGRNVIWKETVYPMAGILGWDFVMHERPVGHGYSSLEVTGQNPFYGKGNIIRGHEFHYSRPVPAGQGPSGSLTCKVLRGYGFDGQSDGLCYKNVFGSYTHTHALWQKGWAEGVINAANMFRASRDSLAAK